MKVLQKAATSTFFTVVIAILSLALTALIVSVTISALRGSDFDRSRIIDDSLFYRQSSMSATSVQNFLNAKVPVCDTNGTKPSGRSGYPTRADWGRANGVAPPYICLKDFRQNTPATPLSAGLCSAMSSKTNRSAAQIITDVSNACGIDAKVILVLLQKEQSLISDDWPWPIQYRAATGYGCPDTAACDSQYYGFFNQVYNAAKQFKNYKARPDVFNYAVGRKSFVAYQANAPSCGGTNITMQNAATAALYNYTPYQPNAAALANLYGTGDSCSAYGNRNFWRLYNDWFGPTTNSDAYWSVVRHPTDGRYFIATSNAVHYIPNQQTLTDWGIDDIEPVTVDLDYITSRTYGSPANRLLRDKFGNLFLVDGGERHYIRDSRYLELWGLDINSAITVTGLTSFLTDGDWLGYCARSNSNPANTWVINAIHKLSASTDQQQAWGCAANTTRLTDTFINTYPSGGSASNFVVNGSSKFFVDQGILWTNNSTNIVDHYKPSGTNYIYIDGRLQRLLNTRVISHFAQNNSNGQWFLIENGKKHYIDSIKLARLWGYSNNLTPLSPTLLGQIATSDSLTPLARTASPNRYYIMGEGQKHYLPNQTAIDEWSKPGTNVVLYANNFLDTFPEGDAVNYAIGRNSKTGGLFIAQDGGRYNLPSSNLQNAWNANQRVNVNDGLFAYLDDRGVAPVMVNDGVSHYLLDDAVLNPIPSSQSSSWNLSQSVEVLPSTLSRYSISGISMKPFVKINGQTYAMLNGRKTKLTSSATAVISSSNIVNLSRDNLLSNTPNGSHLLRSATPSDTRLWLVTKDGKVQLPTTAHALNLGYISQRYELTLMSPEALDLIPTVSSSPSLLIQSPGGALKLVSFGEGLSLPDGPTVNAYASVTSSVTPVSQEIFNLFSIRREASRLIRDDSGKVYWLEGGQKRWILNGALLNTTYKGISQTYLHGTVTTLIPNGSVIQ